MLKTNLKLFSMIKNYLLIAYRNLAKKKLFNVINIIGLAIGIGAFLLIATFVHQQKSYDTFHKNSQNVFRILYQQPYEENSSRVVGLTSFPLREGIAMNSSAIEEILTIRPMGNNYNLGYEGKKINGNTAVLSTPELFNFFDFPLLKGSESTALKMPNSVVITDKLAKNLFDNLDPMGKLITLEMAGGVNLIVTGVVKKIPNTHVNYDAFINYNSTTVEGGKFSDWYIQSVYNYIKVKPSEEISKLENEITSWFHKNVSYATDEDKLLLQPLSAIYLHSSKVQFTDLFKSGNFQNLQILQIIGIFILVVAIINYINITTAKATSRGREVGTRKVLGAKRGQLIFQFLAESTLLTITALIFAGAIASLAWPSFLNLIGQNESMVLFSWQELTIFSMLLVVTISLAAGLYPAFIMSGFSISRSLKNNPGFGKGAIVRKALIVFHFTVAIGLIASTFIIFSQTAYMQNKELGFNKEQVVVIPISNAPGIIDHLQTFKQELMQSSNVQSVTVSTDILGNGYTNNSGKIYPQDYNEKSLLTTIFMTDANFADTYELEIIEGRNLNEELTSDSSAVIVNQEFVNAAGWESPMNKTIRYCEDCNEKFRVVGVVNNFHFQPLHYEIKPAMFMLSDYNKWYISARIAGDNTQETIKYIADEWEKLEGEVAFSYDFVDQKFEKFYHSEKKLFESIGLFAAISIIITCLGLYGLAGYMVEKRKKEISIRKVYGSTIKNLLLLLNRGYGWLVVIGCILIIPLTIWLLNYWLETFAYSIKISWWQLILPVVIVLLITLTTVTFQTYKAAISNPSENLRSNDE
jgi:putative ABC transport system permease protein